MSFCRRHVSFGTVSFGDLRHVTIVTPNMQQMFLVPDFSQQEGFEHAVVHFLFSGLSLKSLRVEEFRRGMEAKLKENGW